jgi:hypothetical protein
MAHATSVLTTLVHRPGVTASAALAASGLAIAAAPERVGQALSIPPISPRGVAEMRIGVGGTFAALGLWALLRGTSDAYTAVGVTWLGAAAVRLLSLRIDEPETDATFWAYLAAESTLGVAGVVAGNRRGAAAASS